MTTTIQITTRGTMTLPKRIREQLGVPRGGTVMAEIGEDGVVLHPAVSYPIELYSSARIEEFDRAERALAKRLSKRRQ